MRLSRSIAYGLEKLSHDPRRSTDLVVGGVRLNADQWQYGQRYSIDSHEECHESGGSGHIGGSGLAFPPVL